MKIRAKCRYTKSGDWHYIVDTQEILNLDIECNEHPGSIIEDFVITSLDIEEE